MNKVLDVVPLRSFVAVADCGGFHRAAKALHLSQSTISQHIRRLEAVTGCALMERDGRHSRLTASGETLLAEARRMLAVHDGMLRRLGVDRDEDIVVGSTEHAADQLLPELSAALDGSFGVGRIRFRLDRGARLREALDRGDIDLALLLGQAEDEQSAGAGMLRLQWYAAPEWSRPPEGERISLVAFDEPCVLRKRALDTLAEHRLPASVVCDAAYLAGVLAAARAGLGVALLATIDRIPEGLVPVTELPVVPKVPLSVWGRRGLRPELVHRAAGAIEDLLGPHLAAAG